MLQLTSTEVVMEILTALRDVTPLLKGDKIEKAIAGIAEAKEIVAKKREVLAAEGRTLEISAKFDKREADVSERENLITAAEAELASRRATIDADELALGSRKAQMDKRERLLNEREDSVVAREAVINAKYDDINDQLAKALREAEALKESYIEKLNQLSKVEGA